MVSQENKQRGFQMTFNGYPNFSLRIMLVVESACFQKRLGVKSAFDFPYAISPVNDDLLDLTTKERGKQL